MDSEDFVNCCSPTYATDRGMLYSPVVISGLEKCCVGASALRGVFVSCEAQSEQVCVAQVQTRGTLGQKA